MERIQLFDAQKLEAACRVLADTERGLTGSEIGYLLQDCKLVDNSPTMTKRALAIFLLEYSVQLEILLHMHQKSHGQLQNKMHWTFFLWFPLFIVSWMLRLK